MCTPVCCCSWGLHMEAWPCWCSPRALPSCSSNACTALPAPHPPQEEIHPKNLLMIGPTGCGKTEIARRLAKMCGAPFVKVRGCEGGVGCFVAGTAALLLLPLSGCTSCGRRCVRPPAELCVPSPPTAPPLQVEATKFTEVGFHGRDVDQIIRDLLDNAIIMMRQVGAGLWAVGVYV